jgi:hypothetical protein
MARLGRARALRHAARLAFASRGALTAVLDRAVRCAAPAVVVDLSRVTLLAAAISGRP